MNLQEKLLNEFTKNKKLKKPTNKQFKNPSNKKANAVQKEC